MARFLAWDVVDEVIDGDEKVVIHYVQKSNYEPIVEFNLVKPHGFSTLGKWPLPLVGFEVASTLWEELCSPRQKFSAEKADRVVRLVIEKLEEMAGGNLTLDMRIISQPFSWILPDRSAL